MMDWRQWCQGKLVSPERAVSEIKSGEKVVIGQDWEIVEALARRREELRGVIVVGGGAAGATLAEPGWQESFEVWEGGGFRGIREAIAQGRAQYAADPFSFQNPDRLLEPGRASINLGADWAVIPVGAPNANGFCSFGPSANRNPSLAKTARKVIAVVYPDYPWTYGEAISLSEIDYLVEAKPPPPEKIIRQPLTPEDEVEAIKVIGTLASELIRDGDTIQIGTGATPQAVEPCLTHKNDLGVHAEAMGRVAVLDLVKAGVITGKKKNINPGKFVVSFLLVQPTADGYQECMDFIDRNPTFEFRDISYTNHMGVIASHDNMVAVNGALAIDLRGQVIVNYVGFTPVATVGGNLDFTIGSHYSRGGRSIYTLLSTAKGGTASRIVPRFPEGAPVTCPCFYVDYLVTEHGAVNLEGRPPRQRAEAIISVAHPNFQPELRREAKKMFGP